MAAEYGERGMSMAFEEAGEPIAEPVTKVGGQPVWLEEPVWPLAAKTGDPMRFIGQFRLPGERVRLGYLFMTEEETFVDGTFEVDGGENAFIVQPGGRLAPFYEVTEAATGPTHGPDHRASLSPYTPGPPDEGDVAFAREMGEEAGPQYGLECRIGGRPGWLQGEEDPEEEGEWVFAAQLDYCGMPFEVNFGDTGVGYCFYEEKTGEGRFLWQCG
ncbi:hypothetical protein [Nocardiopsis composta]|uniref:DUF1963 domain-containing protein n=1 Tax=Nocardiopsis composta TaxID=157465 RepID=A0A7W8QJC4_9ACTN|nr:hypothetical protein [Nocardiopsis composta]MBB5431299.1 hypothetical protein [Nocardiopsis composta]